MKEFVLFDRILFKDFKVDKIQEIVIPSSNIIRITERRFKENVELSAEAELEKNIKDKIENASGFSEVELEVKYNSTVCYERYAVLGKPSDIYKQML